MHRYKLNHVFQYAQNIAVHEMPCGGTRGSQSVRVHFPYPYCRQAICVTQTQSTAKTSLSVHVNDFVI